MFNLDHDGRTTKKQKQRETLERNIRRGRDAEKYFEHALIAQGNDCRRIHEGGDYVVQKKDWRRNAVGKPITSEIKTGNSNLSKAQKRTKRRLGRNFKEIRY